MKKTLTLVGLGTCALLAFASCKSTRGHSNNEGLPTSFVADDESAPWESEIPSWLTEDSSNAPQRDAGSTTILPAPAEPVADNRRSRVSGRQNRPSVTPDNNNDVIAETGNNNTGVDPLAPDNGQTSTSSSSHTSSGAIASNTGSSSSHHAGSGAGKSGKSGSTTPKRKPAKKLSQPTLVVYKVRPGDNLTTIAKRSNTTVAQIRRDSGITGDIIRPGQTIKVRYTPKGYKPSANKDKNGKDKKGSASTKPTTAKGGKAYTVRNGDTISGIAKKNGVSTAALLKANGMSGADATKIRPGKKLTIPKN